MHRIWTLLGLLLALPVAAQAQSRPGQAPGAQAPSGQPPLTVEPGDFWADVRSWDDQARRRLGRNAAPAMPTPGDATPAPRPRPRRPAQQQPQQR
ncbi:hypothetical protein [Belnapia moabensis]|uniref:hypothetical protein n=1 Tax=Belnapia moabensis TaxID=365533 RepID=UPI0005BB56D6|nr:hypothetical protein [Belnapia moabensis]